MLYIKNITKIILIYLLLIICNEYNLYSFSEKASSFCNFYNFNYVEKTYAMENKDKYIMQNNAGIRGNIDSSDIKSNKKILNSINSANTKKPSNTQKNKKEYNNKIQNINNTRINTNTDVNNNINANINTNAPIINNETNDEINIDKEDINTAIFYLDNSEDPDNREYTIRHFHNKILVIYFWASWCLECLDSLENLDNLKKRLVLNKINNIEILPISIDFKNSSYVKLLYKKHKIENLFLFFDRNRSMMSAFNINTPPTTFIVDIDGKIIYRFNNNINWNNKVFYNALIKISRGEIGDINFNEIINNDTKIKGQKLIVVDDENERKINEKKVTIIK